MAKHAVLSSGTTVWRSVSCLKSELRLDLTLACGQSFRWRETAEGHWTGVMGGRVWTLTQTDDALWYHVYTNKEVKDGKCGGSIQEEKKTDIKWKDEQIKEEREPQPITAGHNDDVEARLLKDYFQLRVKLLDLYKEWGSADCHFKKIADIFTGVRMLRQDPTECLFSFICTSNNHISRIQGMIERLCQALGTPLCQLDQTSYYDFPTIPVLADNSVEARLRDLGFGYRARFLQQSARQILETHGLQWLEGLRGVPYLEARNDLRALPGVGTKVADCVCLMSLDKPEAVPIDTHVWQIAKRDYNYAANNGQKTLTDKLHTEIGNFFRELWGPYAGWAHSVLFCADLKKFQSLKETTNPMQPKKEQEEDMKNHEKTKIKRQIDGSGTHTKTKSDCPKKARLSMKKEKIM